MKRTRQRQRVAAGLDLDGKGVVIYTRVSTAEQTEGLSLEVQAAECYAWARRNHKDVVATFTDAGVSAKTADDRKGLQRALRWCEDRHPQALVVYKLDRLARNAVDALTIRYRLRAAGVELQSATEVLSSDPAGDLISTILSGVAEFDNRQKEVRVRRSMLEVAKRGGWPFMPPIGYKRLFVDGLPSLEPDGDTAEALGAALRLYADGVISKKDAYARLAAIGIRPSAVPKVMANPIYAGIATGKLTGHVDYPGRWTPLITIEQHQRILDTVRRQRAGDPKKLRSAFHGLCVCARCGATLTAYTAKGRTYHKCRYGCTAIADTALRRQLLQIIATSALPKILEEVAGRLRAYARKKAASDRKTANSRAAVRDQLQQRHDRLLELYLDGGLSKEDYQQKSLELRAKMQNLEEDVNTLRGNVEVMVADMLRVVDLLSHVDTFLTAFPVDTVRTALRHIFGAFAVTEEKKCVVRSNHASSTLFNILCEDSQPTQKWHPQGESNSSYRHEKPVS